MDDSWLTASFILPVVLGVGLLFAGFGIGTACTDTPGNGGLWESPCNRVDLGIKVGVGAEAVLCVIAVMLALRSRETTRVTRTLVVLSIASLVVSLAIATSY